MKMQKEAGMKLAGNFTAEDVKTLEKLLHKVLSNIEEKIVPQIEQ